MDIRPKAIAITAAATFLLWVPTASYAGSLAHSVSTFAETLSRYLKSEGQKAIVVQKFVSLPSTMNSSGIEVKVKDAVLEAGIQIADNSLDSSTAFELTAELSLDASGHTPTQTIKIHLLNSAGGLVDSFREFVARENQRNKQIDPDFKPTLLASSVGALELRVDRTVDVFSSTNVNVDFAIAVEKATGIASDLPHPTPGNAAEDGRKAIEVMEGEFVSAIKAPRFSVDQSGIELRAIEESHFSMKIERARLQPGQSTPTAAQFQPVKIQDKKGRAFVDLRDGDFFRVVVRNGSRNEIHLELLLDGVNSLHFSNSETIQKNGKWLIPGSDLSVNPPRLSTGVISGWFISAGEGSRHFVISSEPIAVGGRYRLKKQRIGTIQAVFHPTSRGNVVPFLMDAQWNNRGAYNGGLPYAMLTVFHRNPEPPADLSTAPNLIGD